MIPEIDPKGRLSSMGSQLSSLRLWLATFMSLLACYILYSAKEKTIGNPSYIISLAGILYLILGNDFKTIKPNYFIGIKTPWTLESETNWKQTHRLAGMLWFWGGLLIVILSLLLTPQSMFTVLMVVTGIRMVVPVVYSCIFYRKRVSAI